MCPDNLSLTSLQALMNDNLIFEEEVGDDYIYKICNVEGSYNQSADFLGEEVFDDNDDYCINLYKLANCDGDSSCVPYCDLPSSFLQGTSLSFLYSIFWLRFICVDAWCSSVGYDDRSSR